MRNIHQKKNDLGRFDSLEHLWRCLPKGALPGDYAHVGNDIFVWDEHQHNWMLDTYANTDAYLLLQQTGDLDLMGDLRVGGRMTARQHARFKGDVTIEGNLDCRYVKQHDRGFFPHSGTLLQAVPTPKKGDWALVGIDERPQLWQCTTPGEWERVGVVNLENAFDLEAYNKTRDIVEDIARMGYVFEGVAFPQTNPRRTNDHNIFYLSSQPGTYVHFDNIEVHQVSALLWNLDENKQGRWSAVALLDDIVVDTRNITDGAVTLEKLSDGVLKHIDDKDRAIDNKIINIRQQLSGTVKSITINGNSNNKYRPDSNGNVNLVIAQGGAQGDETLAAQVQTNANDIADIKDQIEDVLQNGAKGIMIIGEWVHDDPAEKYVSPVIGSTWYDPVDKILYVSDGQQWQVTELDTEMVYADLVNDRILGFDGEDFWTIASNEGEKRMVVACKLWTANIDRAFWQQGAILDQDYAYDYTAKKLYQYDAEMPDGQHWQERQLKDTCLYIDAVNDKAYRWDRMAADMKPISQNIDIDRELSSSSENPVQNKAVQAAVSTLNTSVGQHATRLATLEGNITAITRTIAQLPDAETTRSMWKALLGTDEPVPLRSTPPLQPQVGTKYLDLQRGKVMRCTALDGQPSTFIIRLRLRTGQTKTVAGSAPMVIRPCEGEQISLLIEAGWDLGFAHDLPSPTATTLSSRFAQALEDAGYNGRYTVEDEQAVDNDIIENERAVKFTIQTIHNRPLETLLTDVWRESSPQAIKDVLFVSYSRLQAYFAFQKDSDTDEYVSIDSNVQGRYDTYAEDDTQTGQQAIIPLMLQINDDAGEILAIAQEINAIAQEIAALAQNIVTKNDEDWTRITSQNAMYAAGPTEDLPDDPSLIIEGMCYYDTTIHKPVWAVNTAQQDESPSYAWLDAAGENPYTIPAELGE